MFVQYPNGTTSLLAVASDGSVPVTVGGTTLGDILTQISAVNTKTVTPVALADNVANPTAPMVGAARMLWNGTTWERSKSAVKVPTTSVVGIANVLGMGVFNSTVPTVTDTQAVPLQADRTGNLRAGFLWRSLKAVTPNDGSDLPDGVAAGLLVTASGNVEIIAEKDNASVTIPVNAGDILPIYVARVKAAGTTATVKAGYC